MVPGISLQMSDTIKGTATVLSLKVCHRGQGGATLEVSHPGRGGALGGATLEVAHLGREGALGGATHAAYPLGQGAPGGITLVAFPLYQGALGGVSHPDMYTLRATLGVQVKVVAQPQDRFQGLLVLGQNKSEKRTAYPSK